jgi:hypothetical protein
MQIIYVKIMLQNNTDFYMFRVLLVHHQGAQESVARCFRFIYIGFGGLEVACWPLVPKFAGSNPAEAVGFLRAEKILSTRSFGGEVKPSVPCRRFTWKFISRPRRVPPSAVTGLSRRWTWRHLAEKVGTSKGGGKQWQPTPKNVSRMQCARAIPVAWLGSGFC